LLAFVYYSNYTQFKQAFTELDCKFYLCLPRRLQFRKYLSLEFYFSSL